MTKATLITGGDRPAVRLERHLADPPAVVWRALTEREQLRSWFPCDVIVDGDKWVVGAAISFPFPAEVIDLTLAGQVLAVEEPHLLVFSWGDDTLRFELGPEDGGTRLVLVNELPPGTAARTATGWEDCLDRLAGLEPSGGSWQSRFDAYCRDSNRLSGRSKAHLRAIRAASLIARDHWTDLQAGVGIVTGGAPTTEIAEEGIVVLTARSFG